MAVNDLDIKLEEVAANFGVTEDDLATSVKIDRFRQMGLEDEAEELLNGLSVVEVDYAELLNQATEIMNDFIRETIKTPFAEGAKVYNQVNFTKYRD